MRSKSRSSGTSGNVKLGSCNPNVVTGDPPPRRSFHDTAGYRSASGVEMNDDDAWAKVRSARVGRLATVTPSDRPHVVPFVFALLELGADHVVYWAVDHKPKRSPDLQRIRNLRANPI